VEAMSDAELVELVLADNQDAFTVLVERYKDAVQNLAYRMLGNVTEAEDVTQEVFVRAYTQLATYKPAHKFSTWLLSIASHLSIDQLRRRRFLALPLEDVPFLEWISDLGTGPEQSALEGEQHDEIQQYLQRLPGKYRAVIVLRYWYDLSYEEIAQVFRMPIGTVRSRLHRTRSRVRELLELEAVVAGVGAAGGATLTGRHATGRREAERATQSRVRGLSRQRRVQVALDVAVGQLDRPVAFDPGERRRAVGRAHFPGLVVENPYGNASRFRHFRLILRDGAQRAGDRAPRARPHPAAAALSARVRARRPSRPLDGP